MTQPGLTNNYSRGIDGRVLSPVMAASSKSSTSSAKRKSASANGITKPGLVTFKVTPSRLRYILDPNSIKDDDPAASADKSQPDTQPGTPSSSAAQGTNQANTANGDGASDSTPGTPAAGSMGPPTEGPKKKGVKRGAAAMNGGDPVAKIRGKPGPKKRKL